MDITRADQAAYVQWDVRNWSRALGFWAAVVGMESLRGARVLDIGSRDGGLSLWFADQGASHVVCSDLHGPTDAARSLHSRAGVADRIEYAGIDATDIPSTDTYDIVAFKSVLGGIGGVGGFVAQAQAIESMRSVLRPGGHLLFAENLVASPLHASLRRRFVRWSDHWRYISEDETRTFLVDFAQVQLAAFGCAGAFGRTEGQRSALARIDRMGLERVVPSSWNYIIAGVATK